MTIQITGHIARLEPVSTQPEDPGEDTQPLPPEDVPTPSEDTTPETADAPAEDTPTDQTDETPGWFKSFLQALIAWLTAWLNK